MQSLPKYLLNSLRKHSLLAGLFLLLALLCSACENSGQPSDKFIEAYIELRVATELHGTTPSAGLARREILKKYGYTRESFNAEADRLRSDYNLWVEYERRVLERLDTLANAHSRPVSDNGNRAASALAVERQLRQEKQEAEAAKAAAKRRLEFEKKRAENPGKKR